MKDEVRSGPGKFGLPPTWELENFKLVVWPFTER